MGHITKRSFSTQDNALCQAGDPEKISKPDKMVPLMFLVLQISSAEAGSSLKHPKTDRGLRSSSQSLVKTTSPPNNLTLRKSRTSDDRAGRHASTTKAPKLLSFSRNTNLL